MQRALAGLDAWISGIRRDQTAARAAVRTVEALPDGRLKINPLAAWTREDLWRYIHAHNLPAHPLFSQGYLSVGCAPCTSPVTRDQDERAGRWSGTGNRVRLYTPALQPPRDATSPARRARSRRGRRFSSRPIRDMAADPTSPIAPSACSTISSARRQPPCSTADGGRYQFLEGDILDNAGRGAPSRMCGR